MLRGGMHPWRKSLLPTLPQQRPPGPAVAPLPQMQAISEKRPTRLWGGLLVTKSSINTCQGKLVWELSMALCRNDSETMESIKEAKATCTHSIKEAKILCPTTIEKSKAICTCSTQEAETLCFMTIREAEGLGSLSGWLTSTIAC